MNILSRHRPQVTRIDRIVPMCEVCRRVYDAGPAGHSVTTWLASAWTDLRTFFRGRAIHHAQIVFARAYCEDCRRSYDLAVTYRDIRLAHRNLFSD